MGKSATEPTWLRILKLLWRDWKESTTKEGFTAAQLAKQLAISPQAVNDALRMMKAQEPPIVAEHPSFLSSGSRSKRGARYIVDGIGLATWPSTAFMILDLLSREHAVAEAASLVDRAMDEKIIDPTTGMPFTRDRIIKQLQFAKEKLYICEVPEHNDLLTVTRRVAKERSYLQFVAEQKALLKP